MFSRDTCLEVERWLLCLVAFMFSNHFCPGSSFIVLILYGCFSPQTNQQNNKGKHWKPGRIKRDSMHVLWLQISYSHPHLGKKILFSLSVHLWLYWNLGLHCSREERTQSKQLAKKTNKQKTRLILVFWSLEYSDPINLNVNLRNF